MAKRFQRVGIIQPETLIEPSSKSTHRAREGVLFQSVGKTPTTDKVSEPKPRLHQVDKAQIRFQKSEASQGTSVSDVPSKAEGRKLTTPETSQGFGGKVIFAQPSPSDAIAATISSQTELERGFGGRAIFGQPPTPNIISTVVRSHPVRAQRWGGQAIVPLYWLDLPPDFEPPTGRNKWSVSRAVPRFRTITNQTNRFKLFVDGYLESPVA